MSASRVVVLFALALVACAADAGRPDVSAAPPSAIAGGPALGSAGAAAEAAAPEPSADAATPVEVVDAGIAPDSGASPLADAGLQQDAAVTVDASIGAAGSNAVDAGHELGAAGQPATAGTGAADSGAAPAPVEVVLCSATSSTSFAGISLDEVSLIAVMGGVDMPGMTVSAPRQPPTLEWDYYDSAGSRTPSTITQRFAATAADGVAEQLRTGQPKIEAVGTVFADSMTVNVPASISPCVIGASDVITAYSISVTVRSGSAMIVGQVLGVRAD